MNDKNEKAVPAETPKETPVPETKTTVSATPETPVPETPVPETPAVASQAIQPVEEEKAKPNLLSVLVAGVKYTVEKGSKLRDFLKTIKAAPNSVVTDASGSTLTPDYVFGNENVVLTITGKASGA